MAIHFCFISSFIPIIALMIVEATNTSSVPDVSFTNTDHSQSNMPIYILVMLIVLCCPFISLIVLVLSYRQHHKQIFEEDISSLVYTQTNDQECVAFAEELKLHSEGDLRIETQAHEWESSPSLSSVEQSNLNEALGVIVLVAIDADENHHHRTADSMMNGERSVSIRSADTEIVHIIKHIRTKQTGCDTVGNSTTRDMHKNDMIATAAVSQFKSQLSKINDGTYPTDIGLIS
eukprot:362329_1